MIHPYVITVTDTASSALAALESVLEPGQIAASVGVAEVVLFQNHFHKNGINKHHWPTTHFWPRAAQATSWQASDDGVTISVNQQGVMQRYHGGPIFPTDGHTYLTIPARAEAYGKTAREFNNLKLVPYTRNGFLAFALVEAVALTSKGKNRGGYNTSLTGAPYFWLVQSVLQAPDPSVIPDSRDIKQVAEESVLSSVKHASDNAKGGT